MSAASAPAAGVAAAPPALTRIAGADRVVEVGGALGYGVRVHAHAACDHLVGTRLTP
ncbi:hypothetical protein [Streptomyces sp. NPDC085540]|uniref:hypothetical protein n=1 Tax=Streptomyces sp. NPDC085540 TaxID=3365730 RepID=UPI0037CF14BA